LFLIQTKINFKSLIFFIIVNIQQNSIIMEILNYEIKKLFQKI